MINPRHYQRIMELMKHEKIVEGGYGDIRLRKIAPTILVNVKEESTVMQEEIFGPLLPIMTYDKLEDAKKWSESLKNEYGFCVPSMQSIWYGRQEKIFHSPEDREALTEYTKKAIDFAKIPGRICARGKRSCFAYSAQ